MSDSALAGDCRDRRHIALLDQRGEPADGLLERGLVVVVVGAPRVLVGVIASCSTPVYMLHWVCPTAAARTAVEAQAVHLDLGLVEARLVSALAALIHRQMGDHLFVRSAVVGIPLADSAGRLL